MDAILRSDRRVVLAILACSLLAFLPTLSAAQEPVKAFDQLNTRLKVGDTVYVTDVQGREVKGKIRELSGSALTLENADTPTLQADAIRLVAQHKGHPIGKGALYGLVCGAAVGMVLGALWVTEWDRSDWSTGDNALATGLVLGAVGAGLGAVIGATRPGKEVVAYRASGASGSARLLLAPVITPRTKGVAVSLSF